MFDFHNASMAMRNSRISAKGATQIELEELYSKYQLIPAMKADFGDTFREAFTDIGIPEDFGMDLLVQIALHRRADIVTMVGILKHHFEEQAHPAQACADMIHKAVENDVLDWDDETQVLVMRFDISAETQERIDRFQYPLPMIEKPQPVRNNRDTGYRTIKGSIILKKNHHEEDVCLDHINRMNAQELKINPNIAAFMQNQWKNIDRRKEGERYEDFLKRQKAFRKFDRTSRDVIDALLSMGGGFYLTHKYDKRGRTYAQGYHVNYQSNDWSKAMIEFAQAEPLKEN